MSLTRVDWLQALTLAERASRPRCANVVDPEFDHQAARYRLRKWREQKPLDQDSAFLRRLAGDGLDGESFLFLLGESASSLAATFPEPPSWLASIVDSLATGWDLAPADLPDAARDNPTHAFLQLAAPFLARVRHSRTRVVQLLRNHPAAPVDLNTIHTILWQDLPRLLLATLSRTMVLEMHVAALRDLLEGETPAERFASFAARLRSPQVVSDLLAEYPVLARLLSARVETWQLMAEEALERLCQDWEALRERFPPAEEAGVLETINFGLGDMHCGGRAVAVFCFSSGFKIVYKPRPLSVQAHFNDLLQWIAVRDGPALRFSAVIDRGAYGWVEHVASGDCTSLDGAGRFYERLGNLLALLYALRGTDFHSENLIASQDDPVIVDLESLFSPILSREDAEPSAESVIADSVMSIGLLPQRTLGGPGFPSFEFSGLGGRGGQVLARNAPYWLASGTDEMRLERGVGKLQAAQNQPRFDGRNLSASDYSESLVTGFSEMYRFLTEWRHELLAPGGPVEACARDHVRLVLRPTRLYGRLLGESSHPDLLRHALDRERLFDRLWFGVDLWPEELQAHAPAIIAAERADLWAGDIPYFGATADGVDILTSSNRRLEAVLPLPAIAGVRRRLLALSEEHFERQVTLLRGSLTALSANVEPVWPPKVTCTPSSPASRDRTLAAAVQVGERLAAQAIRGSHEATWIGVSLRAGSGWGVAPLGLDLYSGLPGVALFLASLGAITHERSFQQLAEAAWAATQSRLAARGSAAFRSVGAYEGWGGMLYCSVALAVIWGRQDLLDQALSIVETALPLIEHDDHLDLVNGCAGLAAVLIATYRILPCSVVLDAAIRCGRRLLARAHPQAQGLGWLTTLFPDRALAGFSHGAAGIAWALARLSELAGDKSFRTAADEALAFERSLFDEAHQSWPDLRYLASDEPSSYPSAGRRFMTAWCNGAPGIGLSRLHLLSEHADPLLRREVEVALRTTLAHGFGTNLSLCHGDLGNLELLALAGNLLDGRWRTEAARISAQVLEAIDETGFRCGVPLGIETPGLMAGLAGIGLGLLRIAEPTRTPCVLLLDLPGSAISEPPPAGS